MGICQLNKINLAFGANELLKDVSLILPKGSKSALAGANGSGKTTLLKIMAKIIEADSGSLFYPKEATIGYLPQQDILHKGFTLYSEVEKGFDYYKPLLERKNYLESTLATITNQEDASSLLVELDEVQHSLLESSYYNRQAIIEQVLKGLGFSQSDLSRECGEFSGGWQMRIALAKILVFHPTLMLLDEPTNYLDLESRIWLRNFIRNSRSTTIIVSHDQDFLDETVDTVYELLSGSLKRYSGNYSKYLLLKEEEEKRLVELYKAQQKEIEKTTQFVERFRYKATKARQVQSRIKQLEKNQIIELPNHLKKVNFKFLAAPHMPNEIVKITNLTKHYPSVTLFNSYSLLLEKGDRLAVLGRNGAGKTTLLRILASKDTNFEGQLSYGPNIEIGYYSQDVKPTLNPNNTVLEELESVSPTNEISRLRTLLGSFLFSGDDVDKKVSVLSGGEQSRLALLKILLKPVNLLILDEPTNHLDIASKEVLANALKEYTGSLIFVSHDKHFIKLLANRVLYLTPQEVLSFEGDYSYFEWKIEQEQQYIPIEQVKEEITVGKESYKEANRKRNEQQKNQKLAEQLLIEIENAQQKVGQIIKEMALEENYSDGDKIKLLLGQKEALEKEIEENEAKWFTLHQQET